MKKYVLAGIMLALIPVTSFAQTGGGVVCTQDAKLCPDGTSVGRVGPNCEFAPCGAKPAQASTTPAPVPVVVSDPGLIPTDFFYFLDNWGENIRIFFTFNKEDKARLHLKYAKERAAEIKAVLADPNAKLENVAGAKENFDKQVADATAIIKEEKDKGMDVSALARELDDDLESSHDEIKGTLQDHANLTSQAESEIRAKLAALSPTDPQVPGLTQALESILKEKMEAVKEHDSIDAELADKQEVFDEAMGPEIAAQKHLEQALRLREWVGKEEGTFPGEFSSSTERLMKQAEDAMKRGDFEAAKNISEEAKHGIQKEQENLIEGREPKQKDLNENEQSKSSRPDAPNGEKKDNTNEGNN